MALTKGFLRPLPQFRKKIVNAGVFLGFLYALSFYGLFYLLREAFRIFTGELGSDLLILTESELYIYNVFYASIACITGMFFCFKFILENSTVANNKKARRKKYYILNTQTFFTWCFWLAFVRLGSLISLFYPQMTFQFEIDFLAEMPLLFILIPIVFFFHLWSPIIRYFGNRAYGWMLASGITVMVLSAMSGFLNLYDVDALNESYKKQSLRHVYHLRKPEVSLIVPQRNSRHINGHDVYLVRSKDGTHKTLAFWESIENPFSVDDMPILIEKHFHHSLVSYGMDTYLPIIHFHIDKDIKLKEVKRFRQILVENGVIDYQYSTGLINSHYPPHYPGFKNSGIKPIPLPEYDTALVSFLDKAERMDLSNKGLMLPIVDSYRLYPRHLAKMLYLDISEDSLRLINGKSISEQKFGLLIQKAIQQNKKDFAFICTTDDNLTFGEYLRVIDVALQAFIKARDEYSLEKYGGKYEDISLYSPERELLDDAFPLRLQFIELTNEEERLLEVMKKAKKIEWLE